MRHLIILTMIAAICLTALAGPADKKYRISVSPMLSLTVDCDSDPSVRTASSNIEKALSTTGQFQVRIGGDIQKYLDNQALGQAGFGAADGVKNMAKGLQSDFLAVGSVAKFAGAYEVDIRAVDVNSWIIMHSYGARTGDVNDACSQAVKEMQLNLSEERIKKMNEDRKDLAVLTVAQFADANSLAEQKALGGAFAEMLNSELGGQSDVKAVERTHAQSIINEKELEMVGIVRSMTKRFRIPGVGYFVEGNFRIFPDFMAVRYQVVTAESNQVVMHGYHQLVNADGLRSLSRVIAKNISDALNNRIGTLTVKCNMPDAQIFIDGEPAGKSPAISYLKKGEHIVRVTRKDYKTEIQNIMIEPKKVKEIMVTLKPVSRELYDQGQAFEGAGQYDKAIQKYDEFIKEYNDSSVAEDALYRKGHVLLFYLNRPQEAITVFETLINRYPEETMRAESYFGTARCYKALGNVQKEKEYIQIILQKFPNSDTAEQARAFL